MAQAAILCLTYSRADGHCAKNQKSQKSDSRKKPWRRICCRYDSTARRASRLRSSPMRSMAAPSLIFTPVMIVCVTLVCVVLCCGVLRSCCGVVCWGAANDDGYQLLSLLCWSTLPTFQAGATQIQARGMLEQRKHNTRIRISSYEH